jgi:hypothetical protein
VSINLGRRLMEGLGPGRKPKVSLSLGVNLKAVLSLGRNSQEILSLGRNPQEMLSPGRNPQEMLSLGVKAMSVRKNPGLIPLLLPGWFGGRVSAVEPRTAKIRAAIKDEVKVMGRLIYGIGKYKTLLLIGLGRSTLLGKTLS